MITRKTLLSGQPGTKKWIDKYGQNLICVRYKYDADRKIKMKTVELKVEEEPWEVNSRKIAANKIVGIRIKFGEVQLGRTVRNAGGKWNRTKKLWEMKYQDVVNLGLTDRIIGNK
ncbi:MAG: hypothetical protein AMJ53_00210 [Gammaproteobacteria bacterium SG8_11]|nr:MAG: hypothetical protein AMJ53_00210 [Gammaproteobacteria bacterium SG8_11]